MNLDPGSLPAGALVIVGVLALVQLTLDAVALVDLARRPRESVVFGNKWAWVAIIVVVNLVGAILYLAVGRQPAPPPPDPPRHHEGATWAQTIADELYGLPGDRNAQ